MAEFNFTFLSLKVLTAHSLSTEEIKSTHLVYLTTTVPSCTIHLTLSQRMASQLYERFVLWMEKRLTRPLVHLMLNKPTRCTVVLQRKESEDRLVNISLLLFFFICNFGSQKRKTEAIQFSWFILTSLCLMIVQTSSVRLRNERTNSWT